MKEIVIHDSLGPYALSPKEQVRLAELMGKKLYFYKKTVWAQEPEIFFISQGKKYYRENIKSEKFKDRYERIDDIDKVDYFNTGFTKNFGKRPHKLDYKYQFDYETLPRDDPNLVKVVKELKPDELKVVTIPDSVDWTIGDYDGREWVAEKHRIWE